MAGLYVHIPWCVRKCPYCDFNSHEKRTDYNEQAYVNKLLEDLEQELSTDSVDLDTVYFGGGTPSLFQPDSFARILERSGLANVVEVTMEANPGTTEYSDLTLYRDAGITRLSLGVQSFDPRHLKALGRIHGSNEAVDAAEKAKTAGFDSLNIDLMYGLPHQSIDQALEDLETAISLQPDHISWYELTIEPNTVFAKSPPPLASTDYRAEMGLAGIELLNSRGYWQYEVSAFARNSSQCLHNVNYWTFGDYIGIGAGAHGKLTARTDIYRTAKVRMPKSYLQEVAGSRTPISKQDLPVEFMMNVLRLTKGVEERLFAQRTGLPLQTIEATLDKLRSWELMYPDRLQLTSSGQRQLNGVVAQFLDLVVECCR